MKQLLDQLQTRIDNLQELKRTKFLAVDYEYYGEVINTLIQTIRILRGLEKKYATKNNDSNGYKKQDAVHRR